MTCTCTGHATPYHIHNDPACDYNKTAVGHSALVGVAMDGYGIYGKYETTGTVPTDLDGLINDCSNIYPPRSEV